MKNQSCYQSLNYLSRMSCYHHHQSLMNYYRFQISKKVMILHFQLMIKQ